jgi:signal transduction histidine kinase
MAEACPESPPTPATAPDFHLLFERAPGLYLVLNPDLTIVAVTDAYLSATMTVREQIVGRGIFEVFPDDPDDPAAEGVRNVRASLERTARDLVTDVMPVQRYDITRPDGTFEQRYWSPTNSAVVDADGRLRYLLHRVQDVTEFVQAGQTVTVANPQQATDDLVAVADAMAAEVFASNRRVAETSRQLKDANAELERLYEQTRQLAEAKSSFFAGISHELRTPLTLILGPVEHLLSVSGDNGLNHGELLTIQRNARVLLAHVNDLLDAAKLEAGGVSLNYSTVELAQFVRATAAHFESRAAELGIRFDVVTPDRLPARVDAEQLRRVLFNLIGNAFTFTPAGGVIRLELSSDGGAVRFDVADSGPGVAVEERELIFERFSQGSTPGVRPTSGTGLGLSIVRDLVTLHGGAVSVSTAPEGGALFTVLLPTDAPPGAELREAGSTSVADAAAPIGEAAAADAALPTVLVVEDSPDLQLLIHRVLGPSYNLLTASDGRAGLAAARKHHPDLIITDVMMPVMSGSELLSELRGDNALATVPVLVLSARADDVGRLDLIRRGANDYLIKPFQIEELQTRVANLVALHQADLRQQATRVLDDRDRIARDLHDLVIQQIYGLALSLAAVSGYDADPEVQTRISATIDGLDRVIVSLRSAIYELRRTADTEGLRAEASALTADAARQLGCTPRITFTGPADSAVPPEVAGHLLAALREALSNVVRHSGAVSVDVSIVTTADDVTLTVHDDGLGIPVPAPWGQGLGNLAARAAELGGTFAVTPAAPHGTTLTWSAPL